MELNGVQLSTYGLTVRPPQDVLSSPQRSYNPIVMPDRPGQMVGLMRIGAKPFQVEGLLEAASMSAADTQLRNLKATCMIGLESTAIFPWSTTRRLVARCMQVQVSEITPTKYDVRLIFDAPDPPFWQGTTQHSVTSIKSTGKTLPSGNARFSPQVLVQGPSSNIRVNVIDSSGSTQATMLWGLTLTSTQYLAIDNDLQTAYRNDSGTFNTGTSVIANLTSGDFFSVVPDWFDAASSSYAVLEVYTGTSSGGTGSALYYKQDE